MATEEDELKELQELRELAALRAKTGSQENKNIRDNPVLGALVGLGRSVPGSDLSSAAVGQMVDQITAPFSGKFINPIESFKENYRRSRKIGEDIEARSPIASAGGRIVGSIPQYAAGTGALSGVKSGVPILNLLLKLGKGGAVNAAIGQGGRGFEVDPSKVAVDAALGAGGEGLSSGVSAVANKLSTIPRKLMNKAIGTTSKQAEKGKDVGQELVDRGVYGTREGLLSKAQAGLNKSETQLQDLLTKSVKNSKPIDKNIILKELEAVKTEYAKPGWESFSKHADELIQEVKKSPEFKKMTASEANVIKRFIYQKLGDTAYLADKLPGFKESQKAFARGLKNAIEDVMPQTKGINEELRIYGTLNKAMKKLLSKGETPQRMGTALHLAGTLGGAGAGFGVGGPVGAGVGALASEAARTTLGKSGTAQFVNFISKLLGRNAEKARFAGPVISGATR